MALKYGTNNITAVKVNDSKNRITGSGGSNNLDIKKIIKDGTTVWCKPYSLTISVVNSSYISSYSVSRTSTEEPTASTGSLSNGSTVYHYDKVSVSVTTKSTTVSYGNWDKSSITAPVIEYDDYDDGEMLIEITNNNNFDVTCVYKIGDRGTQVTTTINANSYKYIYTTSFNTIMYATFKAYKNRTKTTRTYGAGIHFDGFTSQNGESIVTGTPTITITGAISTETTETDSSLLISSTTQFTTPAKLSAPTLSYLMIGHDNGYVWFDAYNPNNVACTLEIYAKMTANGSTRDQTWDSVTIPANSTNEEIMLQLENPSQGTYTVTVQCHLTASGKVYSNTVTISKDYNYYEPVETTTT